MIYKGKLYMTPEKLSEFRSIYTELFGTKKTLDITPDVIKNPRYGRYKVLAPEFYQMMFTARKKCGMRV